MVSIIVPVFNSAKHLKTCVQSLCQQIYRDIEILLIDDGSQDNSGTLCDEYAREDERIRVFHKKNGGVSSARNLGIKEARGRYFVCVDSDDYVEPDYILMLMEARCKFSDVGHVWCGFQTVTDYDKENAKPYISGSELYGFFDRSKIMSLHEMWMDTSPCTRLYDTELVKTNGIWMDIELCLGEDMLFNYEYLDKVANTNIIIINKPLYNYVRVQNESLDHRYYSDLYNIYLKGFQNISYYLGKWNVDILQWKLFWNDVFYKFEKVLRNTMREENDESLKNKIKCNNDIMRSEEFQKSYKMFTGHLHPLYKKAYKSKKYFFVWFLDQLVNFKQRFL